MDRPALVLSTCPDEETAERLARILVEARLAACVNILPGIRSIYPWEGRVEREREVLMIIKTGGAKFEALSERLSREHPYEVPEILRLDIGGGSAAYLDWMAHWLKG